MRSQAYDMVLNGWELGSGQRPDPPPEMQQRIFALLGIGRDEAQARFGFLLDAFRFGAPPHAGFAFGVDRLVALLAGEENIREVIAFPKTQTGADPLTGAPEPDRPRCSYASSVSRVAPKADPKSWRAVVLDLDLTRSTSPISIASPTASRIALFTELRREAPVWWQEPTVHTPGGEGFWVDHPARRRRAGGARPGRRSPVETGPGRSARAERSSRTCPPASAPA